MAAIRSIVITGFMGSGKTSVADALGKLLHRPAIDLDSEITQHEGRTPAALIRQNGEASFRKIESAALRNVLERGARIVALGGGAWTIAANRKLVSEFNAFSIWLDVPFENCWKRIAATRISRPLARTKAEAKLLYDSRRPLYKLADLRVDGLGLNAHQLAQQVAAALPKDLSSPS